MRKVTGIATYSAHVDCPYCGHYMDTVEQEEDSEITSLMFENTTDSCTNMGVTCACQKCGEEFILDEIEY